MSKEDIERLNTAIISSHTLKDEIKRAAVAGTNVSRISGNAPNSTACVLFHTPKAGFTYAVAAVKEKNRFSQILEQVMNLGEIKNVALAKALQYDVSYISIIGSN